MTAYDPPKPVIVHPEVGWSEYPRRDNSREWRRSSHEAVDVPYSRDWFSWWTPGWSMTVATEHDMNIARSLALNIGCAERMKILESAWSLCKNDK